MGNEWLLTLKNLLMPIFCHWCGRRLLTEENGYFCPKCWEMSPRIRRPFCSVCGQPHAGAIGFATQSNFPCHLCRAARPRPWRRIFGAAYYQDAIAEGIKLFKFHDRARLAPILAEVMADFAAQEMMDAKPDYLVPVPLHRVRKRDRGYNQSLFLAKELLAIFPEAKVDESLRRLRPTRVQSRLKEEALRRANIRGAFAVLGGVHLAGASVLLIDDVVTTSGTVSECARALKRAGVRQVDVFATALAITTPNEER